MIEVKGPERSISYGDFGCRAPFTAGTHTHTADPDSMKIDHKAKKVTYGMKPGPSMRRFPATSIIKIPPVRKP